MGKNGPQNLRNILFLLVTIAVSTGCLEFFQRPEAVADYGYVEVKGSDTMVNLAQAWAERFMEKNDETYISVTGGGSGTGIAALINDNTDIAASSREMKAKEIENARTRGVDVWGFIVAQDGLAVAVNQENPIDSLTLSELKDIFTGKIREWKDIGWEDGGEISVYSRQSNSGTYVFFNEEVMDGEDWAQGTKFLPGSASINDGIKTDKDGIGYYGVGYIEGVKALKISKDQKTEPVSPMDLEMVAKGKYPLSRPLFLYLNGKPTGTVLEFLNFALSVEGQELVVEEEYYPIGEEVMAENLRTFKFAGVELL
jgi:phosphate transport system substrate-binding protein